ncbi:MAG: O-antigen ligase family protein [Gemmataceae bacterium]
MEGILLLLVSLSPWVYGAVHPGFEFLLDAGVALLLLLWGTRMLLQRQVTWKKEPVALCLAGLFLLAMGQVTSLPRAVLARISPATTSLYDRLLPEQAETLPAGVDRAISSSPAGSTPSLYPSATRREASRLLAVFLVFAVVCNNLVSTAAFWRFSAIALLNGALLSLFALAQFFSSPANTLYWSYPSRGQVFGPFINHSDFAEYVNPCIGLGFGLLVGRGLRSTGMPAGAGTLSPRDRSSSLVALLHDPPSLWICAAVALMVSSVALSRSRGGMVAMMGAAVVCAVLGRLRLGSSFRLSSALLVGALAFGLISWFGLDLLKERYATFWTGEAYDSRVPLWLRSLPIAADFPVWGTGYGTYEFVEPMYRVHVPKDAGLLYDHAHNEYLEILVEGGVPSLLLAVLAIALVYRQCCRALSLQRPGSVAGLTLGALFAFTTVVLHSFCAFGLHIPAIALLATVLCAHLCAQGAANTDAEAGDETKYRFRLGGLAPFGGAVTAVFLGLVLCAGTWKAHRIDRLQSAAVPESNRSEEQLRHRVALLAAAASLSPDDANLQCLLGQARDQLHKLDSVRRLLTGRSGTRQDALALRAYLRARDACPLCVEAQLGIAALAARLTQGDPQEAYLRRAKLLAPSYPEHWYQCGRIELAAGHADAAWASWRRALELSPDYLVKVLPMASSLLGSETLIESVLPDDADILLAAAVRLHPDPEAVNERRPFLRKALQLVQSKGAARQSHDYQVTARIHKGLDQSKEAVAAYRELLRREPRRADWRLEFARYLCDIHQLEEARRELVLVLNQEPEQGPARELLHKVTSDLLRERSENRSGRRGE